MPAVPDSSVMKLGLCVSLEMADHAQAAGADFIEVNVQSFLRPEQPDEAFAENQTRAQHSPVPIEAANCFLPADLPCVGPDVDRDRLARYAATAFRRAASVGIEVIVFGSGSARRVPEGFPRERAMEQFVECLRMIAPLAGARGVTVVVEPLNRAECNLINSLAEGAEAVEACAHPAVKLLADFYHMAREDEPPAEIGKYGRLLRHAHLAEKAGRTPPGTAGDDFRAYFSELRRAGYRGRLAIECKWENLAAQAAPSLQALRAQLKEQS